MEKWLPELIKVEAGGEELNRIIYKKLARIQLIQERMTQIAYSGDNSAAQVGAGLGALRAVREELELRTRMGQISPQTVKVQQEVKMLELGEAELARYIGVIVESAMALEAREPDPETLREDTE